MEGTITPYRRALYEFKRRYWARLMAETGGHVKTAAQLAGINRTQCYKVLHKYKIHFRPKGKCGHRGNWGALTDDQPDLDPAGAYSPPSRRSTPRRALCAKSD